MNVSVTGRRGLGKSTLALKVAKDLNANVLAFDTNSQFKNADFHTSDPEKVGELLEQSESWDHPLYLAFIPTGDVEEDWNHFSDVIWPYGDYSLIVDEAHRLQKPQYVNQNLDRVMRQAPRRERGDSNPIDVIQCFHRPVDMNGIILSLLDFSYYFRITKKRDLDYIEKEFGPEVAEAVKQLRTPPPKEQRDVIRVDVETDEYILLTDSREWYTVIQEPAKKSSPNFIKQLF